MKGETASSRVRGKNTITRYNLYLLTSVHAWTGLTHDKQNRKAHPEESEGTMRESKSEVPKKEVRWTLNGVP